MRPWDNTCSTGVEATKHWHWLRFIGLLRSTIPQVLKQHVLTLNLLLKLKLQQLLQAQLLLRVEVRASL